MTHRTFIAVILATALAVTGLTTTSARAGNDDVAKWIAGAVAIGIIGAAIAEEKKRDRRRDQAVTRQQNQSHVYKQQRQKQVYGHGAHKQKQRHVKQDQRRLLPNSCRVRLRTHQGEHRGFGRRCLLNNYANFNALPHQCAYRPNANRGRVIYGRDCLRNHGYRTAAY